jgi:hypothetical protein
LPGALSVEPELLGPMVSSVVATVSQVSHDAGHLAVRLDRFGDAGRIQLGNGLAGLSLEAESGLSVSPAADSPVLAVAEGRGRAPARWPARPPRR